MAKKKIALVLYSFNTNGPAHTRITLAKAFLNAGYDVDIVVNTASGELSHLLPKQVSLHVLNTNRLRSFVIALGKYMRSARPDGVISSSWPYTAATVIATRLFSRRTKILISEHADFRTSVEISGEFTRKDKFLLKYFARYIYRSADAVVGVSQGVMDGLVDYSNADPSNIRVIFNPVREFISDEPMLQSELSLLETHWKRSSKNVLAVGRLAYPKDYPMMMRAMEIVCRYKDINLIVIGDGSLMGDVQELVNAVDLQDKVHLVGKVKNPHLFYEQADLFIMTSCSEGFGNVMVEALSYGVPVVSTNCKSGPAEILDHGTYGRLTPVGDHEAFAKAVMECLDEATEREKLLARAEFFSSENIAQQYLTALGL